MAKLQGVEINFGKCLLKVERTLKQIDQQALFSVSSTVVLNQSFSLIEKNTCAFNENSNMLKGHETHSH